MTTETDTIPDETVEEVVDRAGTDAEQTEQVEQTEQAEQTGKAGRTRPTRAERLEARAARLREAEQERAERPAGAAAARRWKVATAVLATAVVLAAGAAVWCAVALAGRSSDLRAASRVEATRESALAAAQKYAIDFGTYDYTRIEQDFATVRSHLTPAFAKEYATISAGLRDAIVQYKGKATATVQATAIESVTRNTAVALVFLDQSVTNAQSTTPRIDRNRMQLTMQRQADGTWLISNLELK